MSISFEQVQGGELLKWDNPGKEITGVLVGYEATPDTGKGEGNLYEVRTKEGIIPFFAPSLLQKKLKHIPVGRIVKIKYTELSKTRAGNDLKVFEVAHAPATQENLKDIGLDAFEEVADSVEEVKATDVPPFK